MLGYSPIILWKFGCPVFFLCIYYKYQNCHNPCIGGNFNRKK